MPYAAPDSVGKHLGLGSSHNAVEDTYTHTCTCKFITARTGYLPPHSGREGAGDNETGPIGRGDNSLISPAAWSLGAEMREVEYCFV